MQGYKGKWIFYLLSDWTVNLFLQIIKWNQINGKESLLNVIILIQRLFYAVYLPESKSKVESLYKLIIYGHIYLIYSCPLAFRVEFLVCGIRYEYYHSEKYLIETYFCQHSSIHDFFGKFLN